MFHDVIEQLEQVDMIITKLGQWFEWRTALSVEFSQLANELFVLGSSIDRMNGWLRSHDAASPAASSGEVKLCYAVRLAGKASPLFGGGDYIGRCSKVETVMERRIRYCSPECRDATNAFTNRAEWECSSRLQVCAVSVRIVPITGSSHQLLSLP